MPEPKVSLVSKLTTEILDSATVMRTFPGTVRRVASLQTLSTDLAGQGFRAATGRNAAFALKETHDATRPQHPPSGTRGAAVRKVTFDIQAQEFLKAGSRDRAALVHVSVKAGDNEETYSMHLVAPGGDFKKIVEHTVVDGRVKKAKSWWTRFTGCLKEKCTTACFNALITCPPTGWVAYLACLAVRCGGCAAKCVGCATCRCRWWCKWAVSCCRG